MEKISVDTAVTEYDDPLLGTTVIKVFNQALCFGSIMGKSLIYTNQVRSQGVQLSDDPHDENRPLGIFDHDLDWYIPFTVQQHFAGVETRSPTIKEYNNCPNIIYMTSGNRWDTLDN